MKAKRYELVNVADGWPCSVWRIDKEQDGVVASTWSVFDRELEVTSDGHLSLPGTKVLFVMPEVYDDEDEPD